MTYKIYNEGNQTIIELSNGQQLVGLSKDILIRPAHQGSTEPKFSIHGIRGLEMWDVIPLSDIQDMNGVPYTLGAFKTFYQNELGKGSAGTAAITTVRIKNVILSSVNWVLDVVSNLYEYTYLNELITLSTEPEMIPHNDSVAIVNLSGILPFTTVIDGGMIVYAENEPTGDITVNIIIKTVTDV